MRIVFMFCGIMGSIIMFTEGKISLPIALVIIAVVVLVNKKKKPAQKE